MNNQPNYKSISYILVFVYLVYALLYIFFGEKVPVSDGFGWDGNIYGNAVKDFPQKLINKEFLNMHVERLLPSAVLWAVFTIFSLDFTNQNIILGFEVLNLLFILGTFLLWIKVARTISISGQLEVLGVVTLLLTFPVIKYIPYYPILTDAPGLFEGMLVLTGIVTNRNAYLWIAMFLASFTWPVAALGIPFFLIFKKEYKFELSPPVKLNQWIFIFGLIVLDIFIYYFFIVSNNLGDSYPAFTRMAPESNIYLNLLIGVVTMNIFLYFLFRLLLIINVFKNFSTLLKSVNWINLLISIAILFAVKKYISGFPDAGYVKLSWYAIDLSVANTIQPLTSLLCMILYFGPIIYILIYNWGKVNQLAVAQGIGFTLFFLANLIQCLDPESRHLMFFFPFLMYLALLCLKNTPLTYPFIIAFVIIGFVFSKVWLQINTEEFVTSILNEKVLSNEIHQRYAMHHGQFMSYKYYLIQLPFVIAGGIGLFLAYRKMPGSSD